MTNPAIALRKLASQPTFHAGAVITFTLAVRNTGDVPLTDIVVTDTLVNLTDAPCVDSLEPDEIADCAIEASYTATAADETAGEIVNEAEVSGTPPTGAPVTNSAVAVLTVGPPPAAPGIIMRKIATHDTFVVDDAIEYTFRVGNAGNVPLTDVTIDDPKLGIVNAPCAGVLEVGEAVMCTTTGSYVATQADVDSGTITNTATATGTPPAGDVDTYTYSHTATSTAMPAITLDKTASQPRFKAGDVITYTLTVTNTGNVTLAPVTIDDDRLDLADDRCADALAPGQMLSCTGIYTATEGDSGRSLVNTATARGMTPSGEQVTDDDQLSLGYIVVSLGDYFWFDNNRNGTQDAGEPPVVGATVNLRDGVGEIIATTITDANGYDAFTDLAPSTAYQVQFVAPDGTSFTVPDVGSAGTNSVVDQTGLVKFVSPADGLNLYASGTADNATLDAGIVGFDLVVEKSLTAVEPREGGGVRLTFIITPRNLGPSDALAGWSVTDVLGPGLTVESMNGSDGSYNIQQLTATATAGLPAGSAGPLLVVTATMGSATETRNVAYILPHADDVPEWNPASDTPPASETDTTPTNNDAHVVYVPAV